MNDNDNTPLAADILRGADEIADFIGLPRRKLYHAVSRGSLPTFRIGATICARRSTLLAWITGQEQAPRAA